MTRRAVGIDLGTTHCALASVELEARSASARVERIEQLVARGELEARPLLPSFLYFAHESEGALPLPWDSDRRFAVGEWARARGAEAPGRVVSSAKSWLSHSGVDRRAAILPAGAPDDIERISPVEASFRYLDHLAEAWRAQTSRELGSEEVVLTVPASFDAAARDLTAEAAYAAGLDELTLLEEPQAALYAWLEAAGDDWRRHLSPGDVVLVVDIGGGTTDFSAIAVNEVENQLELVRIAVGDHILLGGDNMDLALAHFLKARLEAEGKSLDRWQLAGLAHACRGAKERLLTDETLSSHPIAIAGRGSQLLGSAISTELLRADVLSVLVDGFFPKTASDARPAARRAGLRELGLPYAHDPGITKHLAHFLTRHAAAAGASGRLLHPTAVLFNGGVVKSDALRERVLEAITSWLETDGAPAPRVLPGADPDLAVARGAAYYARVRRGHGPKIRGGTARAYYVGIESPAPAVPGIEPPVVAMCVAPFGMDEGTTAELPPHELGIVVGESVQFRFFGSSVRREDSAGTTLESWAPGELEELSPIEITLPAEGRDEGDVVPIQLASQVTPVGTLLLEAVALEPLEPGERWKIELGVRKGSAE